MVLRNILCTTQSSSERVMQVLVTGAQALEMLEVIRFSCRRSRGHILRNTRTEKRLNKLNLNFGLSTNCYVAVDSNKAV